MSQKYVLKECAKHGSVNFVMEGRGYHRCTKCRSEAVQRRRDSIKLKAVEYKGGQCEICGYNKCTAAFDFHHLEPEHKDFAISKNGHTRSWDRVKKEIDKCILVCCRCHREIHAREHETQKIDLQSGKRVFKEISYDDCPVCSKSKNSENKFCSHECASKNRRKLDWNSVDLPKLLADNDSNFSAVGRLLGVSDNAIRKQLKKLDLPSNKG